MSQTRNYSKDPAVISKLSPEQRRVTQLGDTEMPGTGALLHNKKPAIYVDVVSGEPLFASSGNPIRSKQPRRRSRPSGAAEQEQRHWHSCIA